MKKASYILLLAVLLSACGKGQWTDDTGGIQDSLIRFPSGDTYDTGDDVIIICDGFSSDASFYLVSGDGNQTMIENVTVTGSGIFFTLEVPAGEYTVVAEQGGERIELGRISVTGASSEIIISSVPDYCLPGESFVIYGSGFTASTAVCLEDGDGTRTELADVSVEGGGMTVHVPEDAPRGKFTLVLSQGGDETAASTAFFITSRRLLSRITYTIASGTLFEHSYTLTVSGHDGDGNVTGFDEYVMTSSTGTDSDGGYTEYSFAPDSEDSGYTDFSIRVRDGKVLSSTFETTQGGTEGLYTFNWEYDSDGYLTYAVSNGSGLGTVWLETVDGNIILEDGDITCSTYDDPDFVNNPFGADMTITVLGTECEIFRVAQLMGLTGTVSQNLPSDIGDAPAEYVYDDEGYVTGASYTDPVTSFNVDVEYVYE